MYACCAGIFLYLDSVISKATSEDIHSISYFVYSMYHVNGISKDTYDTMTKLKDNAEYYIPRILFRLLMDDISNRKIYHEFKKGLNHSSESLYHQIEFIG